MMGDGTSGGDTGSVDSAFVNPSVTMVFAAVVVVVVGVAVVILGVSPEAGVVADADDKKVLGPFDCVINRRGLGLGLALWLGLWLASMLLIAPGLRGGEKW